MRPGLLKPWCGAIYHMYPLLGQAVRRESRQADRPRGVRRGGKERTERIARQNYGRKQWEKNHEKGTKGSRECQVSYRGSTVGTGWAAHPRWEHTSYVFPLILLEARTDCTDGSTGWRKAGWDVLDTSHTGVPRPLGHAG